MTVKQFAPARGADQLRASAGGKFLAAELRFVGDGVPPVIKVIERTTERMTTAARGHLVSAPDDAGETFYIETSGGHVVLRSTARAGLRVALEVPLSGYVSWSGERVAGEPGRLLVMGLGAESTWLLLADTERGAVVHSRQWQDTEEFRLLSSVVGRHGPVLYRSYEVPRQARQGYGPDNPHGYVSAVDIASLKETWRTPWQESGMLYTDHPALTVSGDGRLVAVYALNKLDVLDAATGAQKGRVEFPGPSVVVLRPVPGQPAIVALRRTDLQRTPAGLNEVSVVLVHLPEGGVETLFESQAADYQPPRSFTVVDNEVLLAPGTAPRYAGEPSTWGDEVKGF